MDIHPRQVVHQVGFSLHKNTAKLTENPVQVYHAMFLRPHHSRRLSISFNIRNFCLTIAPLNIL